MSVIQETQLAARNAQKTFAEARVTLSEAADISGLSLNTVKRVLVGNGAHPNSCLQLERALREYIRRGRQPQESVVSLEGDKGRVAVDLMTNLADTLHEQVKTQDPFNQPQMKKLRSLLTLVAASLEALEELDVGDV